jgi:hypothetical protein
MATLIVTIAGAGATWLIVHVAYASEFPTILQHETLQELR